MKTISKTTQLSKTSQRSRRAKSLVLLLVFLLIITQTGCGKKTNEQDASPDSAGEVFPVVSDGFYLDTICTITVYSINESTEEGAPTSESSDEDSSTATINLEHINKIIEGGFDLCKKYEQLFSKTIETSDIAKINSAGGEAVECDPRTVELIQNGIMFGYLSEGSFNIGIGPITELWDFHAMNPVVPEESAIKNALSHVHDCSITSNYDEVSIDGNSVQLSDKEAKLDLGGIAKGYIADRVAEYLIDQGVDGGVVDLGGNIVVIGNKGGSAAHSETGNQESEPESVPGETTSDSDIRVGIKKPYTQSNELVGIVALRDACVVTSGVYERFFEVDGVKYNHILDPRTGYPINSGLESVTVIGPLGTSESCDALATTVLINGEDWLKSALDYELNSSDTESGGFIYLNGFTYILIRDDGSIETFGSDQYIFEASN